MYREFHREISDAPGITRITLVREFERFKIHSVMFTQCARIYRQKLIQSMPCKVRGKLLANGESSKINAWICEPVSSLLFCVLPSFLESCRRMRNRCHGASRIPVLPRW